jgi:AcrR family transcriptional regulator
VIHHVDRRAAQRAQTRERIYDAAMRLFAERGFEAVSVGDITRAAGVTAPTFYAHFNGKEDVVLPVPTAAEFAAVLPLQSDGAGSVAEQMRRLIPLWFSLVGPEEWKAVLARWRVVAGTPSLRRRAPEYERATAEAILDAFAATGAALTASDRVVVHAFLAAVTHALLEWAEGNGERKLEEVAAAAFEALQGL